MHRTEEFHQIGTEGFAQRRVGRECVKGVRERVGSLANSEWGSLLLRNRSWVDGNGWIALRGCLHAGLAEGEHGGHTEVGVGCQVEQLHFAVGRCVAEPSGAADEP